MIATQEQPDQSIASAALYVGDLNPDVTETILFKHFGGESVVTSTKICRDMTTKRSLGYGYVNFRTVEDARNALEHYNYTIIIDRPCRIMWSVRDPTKRKDNRGNLYIKNIDKSVDARTIYQAFFEFGEILSFKIVTDDFGNSKGYGFIHFATEAEARYVMEKVNGLNFKGKNLVVCPFVPKKERGDANKGGQFNNLFVKNFVGDYNEEQLLEKFAKHGIITSSFFPKDEDNKLKGFGFICYKEPESAAKAVESLDGLDLSDGNKLYVRRGMKKNERAQELLRLKEDRKRERYAAMKNSNLYVKNLPDSATEDTLNEIFSKFGTITSCRIMRDEQGNSRKFGFVCFETQEQATNALSINNSIVDNKAIYVAIAQSKDERRYQLAYRFSQLKLGGGVSQVRMVQSQPPFGQFPPGTLPPNADMRQFRHMPHDRNGLMRATPTNPMFIQQFGAPPPQGYMQGNPRHMQPYVGHVQQFHPRFRHGPRGNPQNYVRSNVPNYVMQDQQNVAAALMQQQQHNPASIRAQIPPQGTNSNRQNNVILSQVQSTNGPAVSSNTNVTVPPHESRLFEPIHDLPTVEECLKGDSFQLPPELRTKFGRKIFDYAVHECGSLADEVVGNILARPIVLQIINNPEMIKNSVAVAYQKFAKTKSNNSTE